MGDRSRTSFASDTRLEGLLEARRAKIEQETGQRLSKSALIRSTLRTSLGDTAFEAALAEAHFILAPAIRRAIAKLSREMQGRIVELVEEELSGASRDE